MDTKESNQVIKKEKLIKKLPQILKKPLFAIVTLLLAVICFVVYAAIPEYSYHLKSGKVQFENPESYCTSEDGWCAVVDDRDSIYCLDEDGKLIYAVDVNQFPYENVEILGITFHPNNDLYCHIAIYNESAYLTDQEAIFEIDTAGNVGREIVHYDYRETDNPPSHQARIAGIHFYEGNLCYLYGEDTGSTLMEANLKNPQMNQKAALQQDGYSRIMICHAAPDGGYVILKNDGAIGSISPDGKYTSLYMAEYDARKSEGIFPYDVFAAGDKLYMLAGLENLSLYEWDDSDWKLLFPIKKSIHMPENTDLYALGLGNYGHKLALNINESLYILEKNSLTAYNGGFSLPLSITILIYLKTVLPFIGITLFIGGLISGLGSFMGWKLSILSKQLLSTVPMVLVMLIIVVSSMLFSMADLNTKDILRETIAINEIAAALFDGDALGEITSYESVKNGEVSILNDKLREFINGNKSYWSKNYCISIYVRTTGEQFVCVASSDGANKFMVNIFSTNLPIDEEFYEDSHTYADSMTYGEKQENLHLVLGTPIYRKDGSYDAIMLLTASQNRLIQEILGLGEKMLIHIIIWVSLLIAVITFVSAYNVRALRQAKNVVSQIAGGDFSVRIAKYPKDEIGEICNGVNDMADRLETYFEEKNRNEQFYYKFVPEKFRELLHKEKFTDLALGDAQSEDLTILFCDIRAFSLNSEMMTAKESFDFVNRIYGIAGPIIRKHNGFVDKYIGDAVMALFESADDAVAAGIELYKAIVLNPETAKELGIHSINIGIGIHSGMAQIGIVGEDERMSGTVISNTVNLSSRMESLTKQYGAAMIISKDTLDRIENPDKLTTRYLGMVQVAGVNEVVSLYEVLDCLGEVQRQKREQTKKEFREAVRLFHSGELPQALEIFQKLKENNMEDKAPQLYAQYIEEKLAKGDTEHNVFRFEKKQ